MKDRIALFAALVLCAGPALAQEQTETSDTEQPAPRTPPSCESAPFHAFDFWLGEWDVRQLDRTGTGRNSIQPINRHCALLESYSSESQPFGQSYNFYDPVSGNWNQLWLNPGVIVRMEGPVVVEGELTMTGTITYLNQDEPRPFMGRWTAREDGSVLQEFWERNPETGEWSDWFKGGLYASGVTARKCSPATGDGSAKR